MDKTAETYLRMFCNYNQDNWDELLRLAEFSYCSAQHDTTGYSPFKLDLGWKTKDPLQFIAENGNYFTESVAQLQTRIQESFGDAKLAYEYAPEPQISRNKIHFCNPDYQVGDMGLVHQTNDPWIVLFRQTLTLWNRNPLN